MVTERKLYETAWEELESSQRDDTLPGLHLEQRRIEGVFLPVRWHGRVRRVGGTSPGELGFLKYFDYPRLRDDFAASYERAIDQRAVDRCLERERDRLLAEIECARRGLTHVCSLLDHRVEDAGQRIYAVYRYLDPECRMDRLIARHRGEPMMALGMTHALVDVLAELDAADIVHGRLDERLVYFPDVCDEALGAPCLQPFEPGSHETLEHWLRLADPEGEDAPWRHALSRVLPAIHLHGVLDGTPEDGPIAEGAIARLAAADFARRFPHWEREVTRTLEPRPSTVDVESVAIADGQGVPIRPRPASREDVRLHLRERLVRKAYGTHGELRPTTADDRRAYFRILLRSLGGKLQDVLARTAREASPGTNWVEAFDDNVAVYLERRAEAFPDFAPFAPWLAGGLRLSGEPPALFRLRELSCASIETRLQCELDELVGHARDVFEDRLVERRGVLRTAGLGQLDAVFANALRDLDRDGVVAIVHVRDRVRRYRIVHRVPRGIELAPGLVLFDSRACDGFCLVQDQRVQPLGPSGEITCDGNRHPYRIHRTVDRRILEFEGYYGEHTLFVASSPDEGTPILRIGTRRGKMTFDFRGRREDFEPLVTLLTDPDGRPDVPVRHGFVVESRVRRIVNERGATLDGRPLRDFECGTWIPIEHGSHGDDRLHITLPEEGEEA